MYMKVSSDRVCVENQFIVSGMLPNAIGNAKVLRYYEEIYSEKDSKVYRRKW